MAKDVQLKEYRGVTRKLTWLLCVQAGQALTYDEIQGLTYLQVKGSGIANTCPVLEQGSSNLKDIKPGSYKIEKLCLEPTSFTVKEESQFKDREAEFVKTRLMTRLTYTLDEVILSMPFISWTLKGV